MQTPYDAKTLVCIGLTLVLWASAFAGIRAGLTAYDPATMALLRFGVASIALAIYAVVTKVRLPARQDLPRLAVAGFLGITVYHLALNYGERSVEAGAASLIVASAPVWTSLLATLFLGERLRLLGWAGIALSFIGAALISLGQGDGLSLNLGVGLVLLAAISQSTYFVIQKPILRSYRAIEVVSYVTWVGTLMLLVFLPGLITDMQAAPLDATLAVVYMGIGPGAVAYAAWAYVLSRMQASTASSLLYVVPVIAFIIAWFWLGEIPTYMSIVGGALALAGVALVNKKPGRGDRRDQATGDPALPSRDALPLKTARGGPAQAE
jgi:drug/metabolite transporter (DMT)-like permease